LKSTRRGRCMAVSELNIGARSDDIAMAQRNR
jgi:hypothetical protein